MRHAGRLRSVTVPTTTSGTSHLAPDSGHADLDADLLADLHGEPSQAETVATADTEVVLAADGTFSSGIPALSGPRTERYRQLAITIRQRIETRLAGRVRDLAVRIHGDVIVLEGQCVTYYSKQLAQHAALGVLDGERLENAIVVTM